MKEKLIRYLFLTLLMFVFIAGCQQVEPEPIAVGVVTPESYPNTDAYIVPDKPTLKPYVFRTSKDNMVTIHGFLFVADPELGMPDANDAIFLVPLPEGDGVTMIPTFRIGDVPQADVDERTGEFVFTDIEPGRYIVMVHTIGNTQIPARTEDGSFAIFTITETDRNQTVDVNYLRVP